MCVLFSPYGNRQGQLRHRRSQGTLSGEAGSGPDTSGHKTADCLWHVHTAPSAQHRLLMRVHCLTLKEAWESSL